MAIIPRVIQKMHAFPCRRNDCCDPRLARNALILGPSQSINQASSEFSSLEQAAETTTQPDVSQQPTVPHSPRLVAGVQEGQPSRFSSSVEERIRAPLRASSRAIYTARWFLYGKWCKQNKMYIKSSSVPQIAVFLCYFCTERNSSNQLPLQASGLL